MRQRKDEVVEHHDCPAEVAARLSSAGGLNRFSEPNFRCVWGYNRIVPIHGEWQEFEQLIATLIDKIGDPANGIPPGYTQRRKVTQLKSSVVETRLQPKYLPGNCWHLEMWRPPEEYGSPEEWDKAGAENVGRCLTVHTSGPYPHRGDWELCYPLTHDGTSHGDPLPLIGAVVGEIVMMIIRGRQSFSLQQRRAAIEQELQRQEEGYLNKNIAMMKDSLRPFSGEAFIVKP